VGDRPGKRKRVGERRRRIPEVRRAGLARLRPRLRCSSGGASSSSDDDAAPPAARPTPVKKLSPRMRRPSSGWMRDDRRLPL
jgi:hypothetical protein